MMSLANWRAPLWSGDWINKPNKTREFEVQMHVFKISIFIIRQIWHAHNWLSVTFNKQLFNIRYIFLPGLAASVFSWTLLSSGFWRRLEAKLGTRPTPRAARTPSTDVTPSGVTWNGDRLNRQEMRIQGWTNETGKHRDSNAENGWQKRLKALPVT